MRSGLISIAGQRFGQLVAIRYVGRCRWLCQCDCGAQAIVRGTCLRSGATRSCGCLRIAVIRTHGQSGTPTYASWKSLVCLTRDPARPTYRRSRADRYVDARLLTFDGFLAAMGERPPGHRLARRDTRGPWTPENLYWRPRGRQRPPRKSPQRVYRYEGELLPVAEIARRSGLAARTIRGRLAAGWPPSRAFTEPTAGKRYFFLGRLQTVEAIAAQTGVPKRRIQQRLRAGWDAERAFTEPVGQSVGRARS